MIIAPSYINRVFQDADYQGLVWLTSWICAADAFDMNAADYGLSQPLFVLVEGLSWFAHSARSGVITYFEATPPERQTAMLQALEAEGAPDQFAEKYRLGMNTWKNPTKAAELDRWLDENDEANNRYLWSLARAHRQELEAFVP